MAKPVRSEPHKELLLDLSRVVIRRLGVCWAGNMMVDEQKYENEDENEVEPNQVGLPERKDGWLRLLFLSPSSIASEAWWW